jgi:hypothetical protein
MTPDLLIGRLFDGVWEGIGSVFTSCGVVSIAAFSPLRHKSAKVTRDKSLA